MKSIDELSEKQFMNPIHYKREPLEKKFGNVIGEIRKCKGCRENKKLESALNDLMKQVLYTKRKGE